VDHDLSDPGFRQDFPPACVSNRAVRPSVEMSEPVRAGGTHGLGFSYQDGAKGPGTRDLA